MAINPYPLTTAPPYGRHSDRCGPRPGAPGRGVPPGVAHVAGAGHSSEVSRGQAVPPLCSQLLWWRSVCRMSRPAGGCFASRAQTPADDFVAGLARRECLRLATASLPSPNAAGRPPRFKGGHSNKKSLGEPTRTTTGRRGSRMASSASGLGHPTTWRPPKTRSLQDTVARLAADSARGSRDGVFPGLSLKRTTGLEPATLACEADVLPTELRPRGGVSPPRAACGPPRTELWPCGA